MKMISCVMAVLTVLSFAVLPLWASEATGEAVSEAVSLDKLGDMPLSAGSAKAAARLVGFECAGASATASLNATSDANELEIRVTDITPEARVKFSLAGVDRLVRRVGEFTQALTMSRLGDATVCGGGAIALRSDADQRGVLVLSSTAGGRPLDIMVAAEDGAFVLELPLAGSDTVILQIRTFSGDAALAIERAVGNQVSSNYGVISPGADLSGNNRFKPWIGQGERMKKYAMEDSTSWLFFADQDRLMRPLLADQREAQTRIGYGMTLGEDRTYKDVFDISLGGDLVLLRKKFAPEQMMSVSIRGLLASRFETGGEEPGKGNFPLLCTDYFGGLAVDYADGPNAWELFLYHESSHLGDETILTRAHAWENYSREAARLLYSRDIGPLRLYAGGSYNQHSDVKELEDKFAVQGGAELRFNLADQPFYAAFDVQSWQYHGWRPNYTAQIGWFAGKPMDNPFDLRIFLEYFEGHSNMGQYWDDKEQTLILGAGLSF